MLLFVFGYVLLRSLDIVSAQVTMCVSKALFYVFDGLDCFVLFAVIVSAGHIAGSIECLDVAYSAIDGIFPIFLNSE